MTDEIKNEENKEINFNILGDSNSNNNKYEYDFEKYLIIYEIQNNIFTIEIKNKANSEKYKKQYTQDELIEINKVFSMFDVVEDCIKIIELNKNNFSISIQDNICNLTIKLDTQELPKNKIPDKIIFKIPLIELKLNKNNSSMNQVDKNLRCLKIESNVSMESIINVSDHSSNKSNSSNINLENINNVIQNLVTTIDKLSQENKEIKERLKVLEENNNKLVKLVKDNRINLLKENKKLENSFLILSNNNNNQKKEIYNKVIFDDNFDPGSLSLSIQNDSQNENQNYLTKIYSNFLKNKTKNKNNIEEGGLINKKVKKENKEKDLELDNLFYSDKFDVDIVDDVGLFNKNDEKLNQIPINLKKENNDFFNMKNNVMNIDENEEDKNKRIKINSKSNFDINKSWSINQSSNMVGACINNESKDKKNQSNQNEFAFLKDESKDDEYMF